MGPVPSPARLGCKSGGVRHSAFLVLVACAMSVVVVSCSSSRSNESGPPSCTDTSASASRLVHGCDKDGKHYKSISTRCADGRTMYNVPGAPPHGASGFSGGRIRTHAVSSDELVRCQTGKSLTP